MAYAAVISLLGTIDSLLHSRRISLGCSTDACLEYLYDHATSLAATLEDCSEGVGASEEEVIIEEARRFEDSIEFPLSTHILLWQYQIGQPTFSLNLDHILLWQSQIGQPTFPVNLDHILLLQSQIDQPTFPLYLDHILLWQSQIGQPTFPLNLDLILLLQSQIGQPTFSLNLDQLRRDADSFAQTARKMKENIEELWEQKVSETIEEHVKELFVRKAEELSSATDKCDMVGLFDQFLFIREKLTASETESFYRNVIWISGMAGIGKTSLAKKLLQDPFVKAHFECVAFVRVGQVFRQEEVLDAITAQLNLHDKKMIMEGSFTERLCRILSLRKSLIVLDDVWDKMDFLNDILLLDMESKILVTSRRHLKYHDFLNLKMRFMDEEESWELLRRNVFGEEECPPQLLKPGKKIAEHCEGLPLLINVVAPILLSGAQRNPECWKRVAKKPHSVLEKASHQISEVLLSSYHPLDEDDKLCFLYLAAFPLKCIVPRSTIFNFWHVERLRLTRSSENSGTYGKLLRYNLFMCHEENLFSGISKACSLHCAYWFVSKRVAENNKFLYTINGYADALDECVKSHRRLAIYENVLFAIKDVHKEISSISTVRSVLCTGPYHQYEVPICTQWKVLRVLNAVTIRFYEFPVEVLKLILLRYLALTCNADLPASISKLWNLKFLIVHQHSGIKRVGVESYVPVEVWDLQELEHLEIMGRNLPDPPLHPYAVLLNLIKLLDVGVESCTKAVLESLPRLEKLRIQIEFAPNAAETMSCFDHISCLRRLKSFHSLIINPTLLRPPPPFAIVPLRLEKLTLSGFGYPWEQMRKICKLRFLCELKLQHYAFRGEKWDAKVIRFSQLRRLTIEDTDLVEWTAEDESFSDLHYLTFKNCYKLREIPYFRSVLDIKLVDCNPLAETCAKQKHPEVHWDSGTEKVAANYSWKNEKLKFKRGVKVRSRTPDPSLIMLVEFSQNVGLCEGLSSDGSTEVQESNSSEEG